MNKDSDNVVTKNNNIILTNLMSQFHRRVSKDYSIDFVRMVKDLW